jgi:hypothetical protein
MNTLRKVSAFCFYILGSVLIVLIVLVQRGVGPSILNLSLHLFDLPLLFTGMLFGGSSLYLSLVKDKSSVPLLIVIFLPLAVLFAFFAYLNFALPFSQL